MKNLYNIFKKCSGVTTDSRKVESGNLFFALRGDSFNGNLYAAAALEKGASYVVVDDREVVSDERYILVEDSLTTLQHLATYHRRALGIPILAITGTNGKTTTKELLTKVLAKRYRVTATKGNLNNHIGVPLTLLNFQSGTEFGIVEMGASARGEIEFLCNISLPDFGVVTNIGKAHLEGFGGEEGVRAGKGELYDYICAHNGLIFYRKDDSLLCEMVEQRPKLLAKGYSASNYEGIRSNLAGDYNLYNIAAAACIGEYFGVSQREIARAIESYRPDNSRSQRIETERNTIILDCYNANPSSMRAAIENLAKEKTDREKVVILGDMLELGQYAEEEHRYVIELLDDLNVENRILVGEIFSKVAPHDRSQIFKDSLELRTYLEKKQFAQSLILIKGSNGIGLNSIVDLLG